jgi:hypothetical protein
MGARYLGSRRLAIGVALAVVLSGALTPAIAQAATSQGGFRRVASGDVAAVAASGDWVFYISDRLVRDPSGQLHITGSSGTLLDERTGRRQRLSPPDCPQLTAALMGGPWLYVACSPSSPSQALGVPAPLLYNLATRNWTTVTLDASAANLCSQRWDLAGGCWVVGLGRSSIEFELNCYHCTNAYALQPIPSGPFKDTAAVHPGGHSAFDLNSQAGMQPLCRPWSYPAVTYEWSGKIQREPGWIEPLGRFALAADGPPTGGSYSSYAPAYLEPCGSKRRIKLPGPRDSGLAVTPRAIVWSALTEIDGIRLPSLAHFKIQTPAEVQYGGGYPLIALSSTSVYAIDINGSLLKSPLPRVRSRPVQ